MHRNAALINEIESAAAMLGMSPSTLGEKAGQGGMFFSRLQDGKRCWPETADKVRAYIAHRVASMANEDGGSQVIVQATQKDSEQTENAHLSHNSVVS